MLSGRFTVWCGSVHNKKWLKDIERLPTWTDTAPKTSPSWEKSAASHKGIALGRVVVTHVVILYVLSHSDFTVDSVSPNPSYGLTHTKR